MPNPPTRQLRTIKKSATPPPLFLDLVNGEVLDEIEYPDLEYIVPGILPEGFTILVGPPKAGKSWLALNIALSVATGNNALGSIPILNPRPVLMLALEDGRRRFQSRCRSILGRSKIPTFLDVATRVDYQRLLNDIDTWLYMKSGQKPLVILDTLGKVMPPARAGESAYSRDYRVCGDLKDLSDKYPGSSLTALHHDRKAESDDFVDSVSGTKGITGSVDTLIVLSRDRHQSSGLLNITGRDVLEAEYAIEMQETGIWTLDGTSLEDSTTKSTTIKAKQNLSSIQQNIVDFIAEEGSVTAAQVKSKFGKNAAVYLKRLSDSGRILRAGHNEYTLMKTLKLS